MAEASTDRSPEPSGFDRGAAVTRSLLGYGVLAGVVYLVAGLTLALTRDGFDLARHPLSALMLGDGGWMQRANFVVTGLMTAAAATGFTRALRGARAATAVGALLAAFGLLLILSGVFPPDPVNGFPPGANVGEPSLAGLLHLLFGGLGFLCLAATGIVLGGWFAGRGLHGLARASRGSALLVVLGFVGGAALASQVAGVVLLWIAVVVGWVWLAAASIATYRSVPHPDAHRRAAAAQA